MKTDGKMMKNEDLDVIIVIIIDDDILLKLAKLVFIGEFYGVG